jgi:TRAP transporter TAXI family solute receptor
MQRQLAKAPVAGVALAFLAACGGEGRVEFLSLGTAGTGGIYYPLGGAIASQMSVADSARQYTAEVSGGSVENINRLRSGQMDLAMVIGGTAYQAQRGIGDYDEPVEGLRTVAPLYPNLSHIMVQGNSPAQSVADFNGLRVAVGPAGSGTEILARDILAAHDLTYDDLDPRYLSFAEAAAALRDRVIDAALISVGYPAAAVLEATTTGNVRLIGLDEAAQRRLFDEYPYYSAGEIPAGAYPGVESAIPTLAVMNWIVAMESLDGDVVEVLLNILQNDRVSLERVHDMAKQIDLSNLENPPVPLHPAAAEWLSGR